MMCNSHYLMDKLEKYYLNSSLFYDLQKVFIFEAINSTATPKIFSAIFPRDQFNSYRRV